MMFVCLRELSDLEQVGILACVVLSLILLAVFIRLVRARQWKLLVPIKYKEFTVPLPLPVLLILLAFVPVGAAGWWLHSTFPAQNFSFSQKPWTLGEIKERLEDNSRVRIDLQGNAASFVIDRKVSGACASDLVTSICELYTKELKCEHNCKSHTFTITLRP
jgi:hypothetical protein